MSGRIRINWHNFSQSATVVAVAPAALGFGKKDAVRRGLSLKTDLVGCGNQNQEATDNALESSPNIRGLVLEDVFDALIQKARTTLAKAVQEISFGRSFFGFDTFGKP